MAIVSFTFANFSGTVLNQLNKGEPCERATLDAGADRAVRTREDLTLRRLLFLETGRSCWSVEGVFRADLKTSVWEVV